jgi:hypothetical protein
MKDRSSILLLSVLLLIAVSYKQVFYKILNDQRFLIPVSVDMNGDAEEGLENSTEENTREADQDEDPFGLGEMMMVSFESAAVNSKFLNYSIALLGYYPEIVSPPPQA